MKIYFAGSITGGRSDQGIYFEIINLLASYGQVLTEHIGKIELTATGESITAEEIFIRDVAWLEQSDVVVAEVTTTSLGVGYELGIAEKLEKKVLCLYRPASGQKLSAMIRGNKKFVIRDYQTLEDVKQIFNKELI